MSEKVSLEVVAKGASVKVLVDGKDIADSLSEIEIVLGADGTRRVAMYGQLNEATLAGEYTLAQEGGDTK